MKDELRNRLARIDPMRPGVSTESTTTQSSRKLIEGIMSTQVETRETAPAERRNWLPAAAAMALVVGIAATFALGGGPTVATRPLALNAGQEDITSICMQFSVDELAKAETAFEGTVTSVGDGQVELSVGHWFKGGDAEVVLLEAESGMEALIGGVAFAEGQTYLVSATGGSVNYCGFSGLSTQDLRASFQSAFGG
jgi:hypothetical protein